MPLLHVILFACLGQTAPMNAILLVLHERSAVESSEKLNWFGVKLWTICIEWICTVWVKSVWVNIFLYSNHKPFKSYILQRGRRGWIWEACCVGHVYFVNAIDCIIACTLLYMIYSKAVPFLNTKPSSVHYILLFFIYFPSSVCLLVLKIFHTIHSVLFSLVFLFSFTAITHRLIC